MGTFGNDNLMHISRCSFITTDGTSDPGLTLHKDTKAISVYATAAAWVLVGPGTPVAVPATEKVWSDSLFIPATGWIDVPVPAGTDLKPMKVAAIQNSGAGNVYIYERKD